MPLPLFSLHQWAPSLVLSVVLFIIRRYARRRVNIEVYTKLVIFLIFLKYLIRLLVI